MTVALTALRAPLARLPPYAALSLGLLSGLAFVCAAIGALPASAAPTITIAEPAQNPWITNVSPLTIQGLVSPENSTLTLNGATVPLGANGTFTATASLAEGPNNLTLSALDWTGAPSNLSLQVILDTVPPSLFLTSPTETETLTNRPDFIVRGRVDPPSCLADLNGAALPVDAAGDFALTLTLSDGLNLFRFVVTDPAGNQLVLVRRVTFDRYPPFLQVDAPVSGLLTDRTALDVLGRTEMDARVTVNGFAAAVDPKDGTFTLFSLELDDLFDQTENLIVVRAVDRAGNVAFENRSVIVDTRSPSITLDLSPEVRARVEAGLPLSITTIAVSGSTDSIDAVVTIAGQEVPLSGLSFTRTLVLREGPNIISIRTEDAAGNSREVLLRVIRDTVAPVLSLEAPPEGTELLTNQEVAVVSGHTDDGGSIVWILYEDARGIMQQEAVVTSAIGSPTVFRFEYALLLVTDGEPHDVDVRAVDSAGNPAESRFSYTCKVIPPFLEILGFPRQTADTFVWVNGTTEAGIDSVTINGQQFDVVSQFFSVRWNIPAGFDRYRIDVVIRDAWGNMNRWSGEVELLGAPRLPEDLHIESAALNGTQVAADTPTVFRIATNGTLPALTFVEWFVNGEPAGTGAQLTVSLGRGPHTISATVTSGGSVKTVEYVVVATGGGAPPSNVGAQALAAGAIAAAIAAAAGFLLWTRARNRGPP